MNPLSLNFYIENRNSFNIFNAALIILFLYILIHSFNMKYLQSQYRAYINDCNNLKSYNIIPQNK